MLKYKILIVEDSKLINKTLETKFTEYGYFCKASSTFLEAKSLLETTEFDFIILDLNLPDAYGSKLVKDIKKISEAKIFVLTVEKDLELREALYKDGILDYLIKDKYFNSSVKSMHKTMQSIPENKTIAILSIDDSRYVREEIKKILDTRHYQVYSAEDAKSGFEVLATNSINTIVLDMELPDKNGIDVLRELKDSKQYENIPVIILSGSSNQEMVRECLKIGAFDFIRKPFNIEEFVLKIDMAVSLNKKDLALQDKKEKVEHDLIESNFLAKEYLDAINKCNILSHTDINHKITRVNKKFCEITGYMRMESIGKTHNTLANTDIFESSYDEIIKTIEDGDIWVGKLTRKTKSSEIYYTETTVMPIYDTDQNIIEYLWMSSDITQMMAMHNEIENTQKEMIYKMGEIAESRSDEVGNHVKRVAEYSKKLALLTNLTSKDVHTLYTASPMHDIGKVAISDDILKKPSKLNSEEWEIMKTHTNIGHYLFKNSKRPILKAASIVAYTHHEKWDGSGYPNGLKGEEIPMYGRITAIADVFDALISDRVYKKAWNIGEIKEFFEENGGKHFDPHLTKIFLNNFDLFINLHNQYKDDVAVV